MGPGNSIADALGVDAETFDVVVIGSGAAGLFAAIVARQAGLSVVLLEKTRWFGGTTAYSGGGVWLPGHHHLPGLKQTDDFDTARRYLGAISNGQLDPSRVAAYLETAPEVAQYLEQHTQVRFNPVRIPDYSPDAEGAVAGRTMLTQPFDGRLLGKWLSKLRAPLPAFTLFGSMQVDQLELARFRNALHSPKDFLFSAKRFASFFFDRLRAGRSTRLTNGNALAARLLKTAVDEGIDLRSGARVVRLIRSDGRICGVEVEQGASPTRIGARHGVVIATGGFAGNAALVAKYMPMPESHVAIAPEGNTGEGIALAEQVGGSLTPDNFMNGIWAPVSSLRDKDGRPIKSCPHFGVDRAKPGSLIVDGGGRRFADEAEPYQKLVTTMVERGIGQAWMIGDKTFLQRYGMGMALPRPFSHRAMLKAGYLHRGDTVRDLAIRIGVDPAALEATIERFNSQAADGVDDDFNRGGNRHDRAAGDPAVRPNPNLAPLATAPYYAIALNPGNVSSTVGLRASIDGQVLDDKSIPIAGLYVAGLDQESPFRGLYPSGGASLGGAFVGAFRAARHIVAHARNS